MIAPEERERIRRSYYVDRKSIRQIAREEHSSREKVKKALEILPLSLLRSHLLDLRQYSGHFARGLIHSCVKTILFHASNDIFPQRFSRSFELRATKDVSRASGNILQNGTGPTSRKCICPWSLIPARMLNATGCAVSAHMEFPRNAGEEGGTNL